MASPVYRNNEFTPERCKLMQYCLYEVAKKIIKTGTNIAFIKNMYFLFLVKDGRRRLVIG